MKCEEQKLWRKESVTPTIEAAAKAAFKVDWPKDDWERLGDGYHQARYRSIAYAAIEAFVDCK